MKTVNDLQIGSSVKYQMSYNGLKKYFDALVIDTEPLTLSVKFHDGYRHTTEVAEDQHQFILLS